jgi:hypothetical protein
MKHDFFFLLHIVSPLASTVFCTYVKCAVRTSTRKQLTIGDLYARVVVVVYDMLTAYFDPVSVHATNDILSREPLGKFPITPANKPTPARRHASFPSFFYFSCSSIRRENGGERYD